MNEAETRAELIDPAIAARSRGLAERDVALVDELRSDHDENRPPTG